MIKWRTALLIVLLIAACKKPFNPTGALGNTGKYLVIDGVVNAGSDSTFIKLSRTMNFDTARTPPPETKAQVTVESDGNTTYPLTEATPGTYSAAGLNLDITHKYRVRIKTSNNEEYLSDYVVVKNAPPVDSVGFKDQNGGVQIYVNTHDGSNATRYYRWEYNEDWQFHSYYHADGAVDTYHCFAKDVSSAILTATSAKLTADVIYQAPIATIPLTSEKVEVKYSILVRQYALTSDAYSFWDNLQKNNAGLGTIFDPQPSLNQTNYHCITNPAQTVIGYLSVGSYSTKRIFIAASQLSPGYKEINYFGCRLDTEFYYHPKPGEPVLDGSRSGFAAVEHIYTAPLAPFGGPSETTYSTTVCVSCLVRGTQQVPSFWK